MDHARIEKTAWLSPCGRYRHALGRHWDRAAGFALFIGVNPSTADAEQDDPTIRRCVRFAKDWGYGGLEMCNLFDWRATDPAKLPRKGFAVSEYNDPTLRVRVAGAAVVIAAWGAVPWAQPRIDEIQRTVFAEEPRWHCLGLTKQGYPRHPLYVPAKAVPVLFW
ncbi:MAG TPA: DUF1643 domain-containing protein [Lacipirellulaceae bacterium]|nr:DUF1643 domain-containing protein [Lacipirellulaceae bacterium]